MFHMKPTVVRRLDGLARTYALDPVQRDQLAALLSLLAGSPEAPTTVREATEAVDVHVADSLVALEVEGVRTANVIADLGSGAGFPALVLAVALPAARIHAVESGTRKAAFIARAAEALGLGNVEVVPSRAEEWRAGMGVCDLVTARALAALPVLCEYAAPLLAHGGHLVAWKGQLDSAELDGGRSAAFQLGLSEPRVLPVEPFPGSLHRRLVVTSKVAETPARFPRRAGMALKRPLG